jgi:hypothetical protein
MMRLYKRWVDVLQITSTLKVWRIEAQCMYFLAGYHWSLTTPPIDWLFFWHIRQSTAQIYVALKTEHKV